MNAWRLPRPVSPQEPSGELAIEARAKRLPPPAGFFSFKRHSLMPFTDYEF